jgi:phage terminase small subunit
MSAMVAGLPKPEKVIPLRLRAPKLPPAPRHLSSRMRAWWRQTVEAFELEPHDLHLLRLACEAIDEAERLRVLIADEGAVMLDRFGQRKPHPAVAQRLAAMMTAARLVRQLGFATNDPDGAARIK